MISKKIYAFLLPIVLLGSFVAADSLSAVNIDFCNNESGSVQQSGVIISSGNMLYKVAIQEKGDICYKISNTAATDVFLKVGFVDGTFTNDQWKNRACLSDADTQDFGQYVTGYQSLIALSGLQVIENKANFTYPVWSDWIYHGCLVYSVLEPQINLSGQAPNFTVLMRKAKFIDVFVGDSKAGSKNAISLLDHNAASGENLSQNPKIRLYIDPTDNKYVVQFEIKNISKFDQDVDITGTVSNFLLYNKAFSEPRRLLRGQTLLITKKLDDVPLYNLNVKLDFSYKPYYTFGNEKSESSQMSANTNIWIIDTMFIVSAVGLVLFLIVLTLLIVVLKNQSKNKKKADIKK